MEVPEASGKAPLISPSSPLSGTADTLWLEKYRPQRLDELVSHREIIATLRRMLANGTLPHLLFYGPPGTGKTSTILACAREMYGEHVPSMVLELNASDERGIDVVREQIKTFASTRCIFTAGPSVKLIVLDEADAMTPVAQAALRRVMEKYTANARFCIVCNYANKIIPAIQSRCMRFRFAPLRTEDMVPRLRQIADAERVQVTDDGMQALTQLSGGDMRRCIHVLQSTSLAAPDRRVTAAAVYANTGHPSPQDLHAIVEALWRRGFGDAYRCLAELKSDKGLALTDVVTGVHDTLMRTDLPVSAKAFLYEELANLEWRLASATSETIQLGALVGAFRLAASLVPDAAKENGGDATRSRQRQRLAWMLQRGMSSGTRISS